MGKIRNIPHAFFMLGFFCSCVSIQDRTLTPQEIESVDIIERVSIEFYTYQPLHIIRKKNITRLAYSSLVEEAKRHFYGDMDIVNISANGIFSALTLLPLPTYYGILGNFQRIRASGDIIPISGDLIRVSDILEMEEIQSVDISRVSDVIITRETYNMITAVINASISIAERLPTDSIIAVLNVYSKDRDISEFIIGEIEFNLVNTGKFRIVDRRQLDRIRTELNFQYSGDVDDDTAVSIGHMLGANIVITGEISEVGPSRRLLLRAIDVKTAQIITMARELL